MNANDRFALELGRALVRALIAEAALEQAEAKLALTADASTLAASRDGKKEEARV